MPKAGEQQWGQSAMHHKEDLTQCTSRIDGGTKSFSSLCHLQTEGYSSQKNPMARCAKFLALHRQAFHSNSHRKLWFWPWCEHLAQLKESLLLLASLHFFYYTLQRWVPHYGHQALKSKPQIHPNAQASSFHSQSAPNPDSCRRRRALKHSHVTTHHFEPLLSPAVLL